jgi:hypothetical protein
MPLETTWLIEGKVILAKLSGVATKHDVQVYVIPTTHSWTSEIAQSPIHTIVYALDIEKSPSKLADIGTVLQFSPENRQALWLDDGRQRKSSHCFLDGYYGEISRHTIQSRQNL